MADDGEKALEFPGPRPTRPGVALCYLMSADGRIAPARGASPDFGSKRDRRRLHELRAAACAVLIGARTVATDDPPATVVDDDLSQRRVAAGRPPQPRFFVVSPQATVPPGARLFQQIPGAPQPVVVVGREAPTDRVTKLATVAEVRREDDDLDLAVLLTELRIRDGVKHLLCEGGSKLNATLLAAGLVDEVFITLAPCLLGGDGPAAIEGDAGLSRTQLSLLACHQVGDEVFLHYRVETE